MSVWKEDELKCKPLDTYNEILLFLQDPPPWRTLCQELKPHSKYLIKNFDLVGNTNDPPADFITDTFCHINPDMDDVERHVDKKLPKTLVCHDMANGYHDDCIIDGTGNYDAYTFYNWAGIDIFCYFSHHLITIPPVGWINVGHAHGVKVIGTVITEWSEGEAFWEHILKSERQYKEFARALVTIAKTLKFDGWLLNIENKISKPEELLNFVQFLHRIMHLELPHPELIWYDSVTVDGHLNWQNALNKKNKPFFDACDGLFTNYSWTVKHVASSAELAGERVTDIYIGHDVWGRNFYGGGKFNLHEAVQVAYSNGCSLAIFAPAWTHEAITTNKSDINTVVASDGFSRYDQFLLRDRALWDSVWRFLNTRLPSQLPFKTSFCRGQGKKRRLYGEVLCPVPWYNLRHMQYQPNSLHGPHGYILSSLEQFLLISSQKLKTDSKAIVKLKEELQTIHEDLGTGKITEEINLVIETEDDVKKNNKIVDTDQAVTERAEEHVDETSRAKSISVKRKVKDLFKHIFQNKMLKNEETVEPCHGREDEVDHESTGHDTETVKKRVSAGTLNKKDKHVEVIQEKDIECQEDIKENEIDNHALQKEKASDDKDALPSSGQSTIQMSVNINLGQSVKTSYKLMHAADELQCLEVYFDDSFNGGSCLKVNPSDKVSPEHRTSRLFHCDFYYEDVLVVCVVTKNLLGFEEQCLNLILHMRDGNDENHVVNLIGHNVLAHVVHHEEAADRIVNVYPISHGTDAFRKLQNYLLLNEPDVYVAVENSYNWSVRYYQVEVPRQRVTSINCTAALDRGPLLLGHLALCHLPRSE